MAHVTIRINGYTYTIGCEDGQEAHLTQMAEEVEHRITHVKKNFGGQSGEARLLMMAALLLADELHDLKQGPAEPPTASAKLEQERRARLRRVAARAEEIASDMLDL